MLDGGCSSLMDLDELASMPNESPSFPQPSQDSLVSVATNSSKSYAESSLLSTFKSDLTRQNGTYGQKRSIQRPRRGRPRKLVIMPSTPMDDALSAGLSSLTGSSVPSASSGLGMNHRSTPFPTALEDTSFNASDSADFSACAEAGPGPGTIRARMSKSLAVKSTPDQPAALSTGSRPESIVDDLESHCSEDEGRIEQALSLGLDMIETRGTSTPLEARSFTKVDPTTPVSGRAGSRSSTRTRRLPKYVRENDDHDGHYGKSRTARSKIAEQEEVVVMDPTGVYTHSRKGYITDSKLANASEALLSTENLPHEPLYTPLPSLSDTSGPTRVKRRRSRKPKDPSYANEVLSVKTKTKRSVKENSDDFDPKNPYQRNKRARKAKYNGGLHETLLPPIANAERRIQLGPQAITEQSDVCTFSGRSKRVRKLIHSDLLDDAAFERMLDGGSPERLCNEGFKGHAARDVTPTADTPSSLTSKIDNLSQSGSRAVETGKSALIESPIWPSLTSPTEERQVGTCLALRYASYPKCTACMEQTAGDPCRFRSFRVFPIDPETRMINGSPYFDSQLAVSAEPCLRTTFNVPFGYAHVKRTKSAVNSVVLGIITDELRHVVVNQALIRHIGVDQRSLCDFCSSTIFGGSWFCTQCGRDFCGLCEQWFPATGHLENKHARTLDAAAADRLSRCSATGVTHSKKDFRVVSHFSKRQLQFYWVEIASSILLDKGHLLNSLGRCPVPVGFPHLLDAAGFTPSPPPNPPPFRPKLYRTQTAFRQQLPRDPACLRAVSHPFMVFYNAAALSDSLFDEVWGRGEPIVVRGCLDKLRLDWTPDGFRKRYGSQTCQIVDCQTNEELSMTVGEFFNSFGNYQQPRRAIRKLKDWPSTSDFKESFPDLYDDFNGALPVSNYTRRDGVMNISAHFPDGPLRPDLGPKMYIANAALETPGGHGSTRLHMDIADAINIMVYAAPDARGRPGCAVWDIFRASDSDRIRAFLKRKFGRRYSVVDPIHSQLFYLDSDLRLELAETMEVISWRIYQYPGQAVFIPAGCAHQVCNLADCMKIAMDFVSPHNIQRCQQLTEEFRKENFQDAWKDDVLQLHNLMWYAWLSSQAAEKRLALAGAQPSASTVSDEGKTIPTSAAANASVPEVALAQRLLEVLLADALPSSSPQLPTPSKNPALPLAVASTDIAMEDAAVPVPTDQVVESVEQHAPAPNAANSGDQSIKGQTPLVPKDDQTNRFTDTINPVPQVRMLESSEQPEQPSVNNLDGTVAGTTERTLPSYESLLKHGRLPAETCTCLKPPSVNSRNPVIAEPWPLLSHRATLPYDHFMRQRDAGFRIDTSLARFPLPGRQGEVRSLTVSDQLFNNRGRLWNESPQESVAVPVLNDLDSSTGRQKVTMDTTGFMSPFATSAVKTDSQRCPGGLDSPYPQTAGAASPVPGLPNPEDRRGAASALASGVSAVATPCTSTAFSDQK